MATTMTHPPIVTSFGEFAQAQRLMSALRSEGFRGDQLGLAQRAGELTHTGGALAVAGATDHGVMHALLSLGVRADHARRYEREFAAGRTIVTVHGAGGPAAVARLTRHSSRA